MSLCFVVANFRWVLTRRGIESSDASKDITSESVATRCRSGVRTISGYHVIDRGHVNRVVRNTNKGRENQWRNPRVVLRTSTGPGETEQTDRFERGGEEQPLQTVLRKIRSVLDHLALLKEPGHE